ATSTRCDPTGGRTSSCAAAPSTTSRREVRSRRPSSRSERPRSGRNEKRPGRRTGRAVLRYASLAWGQTPHQVHAQREEVHVRAEIILGRNDVIGAGDAPAHVAAAAEVHSAADVESELALRGVVVAGGAGELGRNVVDAETHLRVGLRVAPCREHYGAVHYGLYRSPRVFRAGTECRLRG